MNSRLLAVPFSVRSMGHLWKREIYSPAYRCVGFQTTMIRATEWLATGKVTYPEPGNFPKKDFPSIRKETDFTNRYNQ